MLSQNLQYIIKERRGLPQGDISETDRYDEEFVKNMLEVEQKYGCLAKHEKIRVELWSRKLCEITKNTTWKQTRNLYSSLLLKMVLRGQISEPFDKVPPEGPLPNLNKFHLVI